MAVRSIWDCDRCKKEFDGSHMWKWQYTIRDSHGNPFTLCEDCTDDLYKFMVTKPDPKPAKNPCGKYITVFPGRNAALQWTLCCKLEKGHYGYHENTLNGQEFAWLQNDNESL